MQHSAQQRSATHTAEHTRAPKHPGSTPAHSSARLEPSCLHIAHSAAQHGCSTTQLQRQSTHTQIFSLGIAFHSFLSHPSAQQQQSLLESMADQQITQHSHAAQRTAEKCNTFHYVHRAHQSTVFCPHCPTIFWNPSCTCNVCHGFAAGHLLQRELRIKLDGTAQKKYD